MSDTATSTVRTTPRRMLIQNLNLIDPRVSYLVTTERGSVYRIRLDTNPTAARKNLATAFLLVSKDGAEEVPQTSHATIWHDEEWEIHPRHKTSPIKSVELA